MVLLPLCEVAGSQTLSNSVVQIDRLRLSSRGSRSFLNRLNPDTWSRPRSRRRERRERASSSLVHILFDGVAQAVMGWLPGWVGVKQAAVSFAVCLCGRQPLPGLCEGVGAVSE